MSIIINDYCQLSVSILDNFGTLPETNLVAPENAWLEDDPAFLLGPGFLVGANS